MTRLYLNLRVDNDFCQDLEGADYLTIADAHREALASAREILAERVRFGVPMGHGTFEIMDETGRLILLVPFEDALASPSDRPRA